MKLGPPGASPAHQTAWGFWHPGAPVHAVPWPCSCQPWMGKPADLVHSTAHPGHLSSIVL